jgi:hypothetical protein
MCFLNLVTYNFRKLKFTFLQDLTNCFKVTIDGVIEIARKNPTIQVLKIDDSLFEVEEITKVIYIFIID